MSGTSSSSFFRAACSLFPSGLGLFRLGVLVDEIAYTPVAIERTRNATREAGIRAKTRGSRRDKDRLGVKDELLSYGL
jgi:hypothetical protein